MNTVEYCYDAFIVSRMLGDLSNKTINNYKDFLLPFVLYVGSDKPIADLSQEDINKYILYVYGRPISKASRSTHIRHLKVFLNWVSQNFDVVYNTQLFKVPKMPKKIVTSLCLSPLSYMRARIALLRYVIQGVFVCALSKIDNTWLSV